MSRGAGPLDRRIDIMRATSTTNEFNEKVLAWQNLVASRAAMAQPVSDGERLRAGETLAETKYRFTIRYSADVADVNPKDRVSYRGKVFDINGVKELDRNHLLEITATARAD